MFGKFCGWLEVCRLYVLLRNLFMFVCCVVLLLVIMLLLIICYCGYFICCSVDSFIVFFVGDEVMY